MMNVEQLRTLCLSFPGVTEEIKWGNDLCFLVAEKMFCITSADADQGASFKAGEEEYAALVQREGIIPAPYLARARWVYVLDFSRLSPQEWYRLVLKSYELVKNKLPRKKQEQL